MHGADPRRSRLAGEEARKSCSAPGDAYAGKPAPTAVRCTVQIPVGAGLPAKAPLRPAHVRWQASSYRARASR
ncbi:hypothetical protein FCI59_22420 [Pseudomonas protegens]|nr:hypothetical protein [Pseudomonas protegens]